MDSTLILQLILQLVLILFNAVFACAEIAVISMNDNKLSQMAANGDKRARRLENLTSRPAKFLATIQVGITLSGFLGSAFAADNFSEVLVDWIMSFDLPVSRTVLDSVSVIVITLVLSYLTLVFGELVPKRLAMKNCEKVALGMSMFISAISKVFAPIVWFLTASTNLILRILRIDPNAEDEQVSEEEISKGIAYIMENHKVIAEGASCVGIAYCLREGTIKPGSNVAIIVTGNGIPMEQIKKIVNDNF